MIRQIVLDTETTGLNPTEHRIIEVGMVESLDHQISHVEKQFYFNVPLRIDPGSYQIHGLSNAFLSQYPPISEHIDEIIDFLRGAEVFIHNASFDTKFLNMELTRLDRPLLATFCSITDTMSIARKKHKKYSLDALCKAYHLDSFERVKHGALVDARLLSQVYFQMMRSRPQLFGDILANDVAPFQDLDYTELVNLYAEDHLYVEHEEYLQFIQQSSEEEVLWNTIRG